MSASTTAVVIEAAHFDPVTIARSARRHKLPSEASKRFERGVDPRSRPVAAQRVADLLVELRRRHDRQRRRRSWVARAREPITIDAPAARPGRRLRDRPTQTAVGRAAQVGCEVTEADGRIRAVPPPWRPDLTDPNDLAEEVVRLVGYDTGAVRAAGGPGRPRAHRAAAAAPPGRHRAGRAGLRRGARPTRSSATVTSTRSASPPTTRARTALRLANPLSDEEPLLRTTLLPGLLRTLAPQRRPGQTTSALFEIGQRRSCRASRAGRGAAPGCRPRADRRRADGARRRAARPAAHVGGRARRERAASAGWWGEARAGDWADAVEAARDVGRAARGRARRSRPTSTRRGTRAAARCSCVGDDRRSATPASCTRGCARRSACPPAPAPWSSTSTR